MTQFFTQNSGIIFRLVLAIILGMLIGAERRFVHKEAGMKTHALVSLGAATFVLVSEALAQRYVGYGSFNPVQMASNIIIGIGFLGAGSIILQGNRLRGLTTAGGLWATAGIGMAAGFGLLNLAIIVTVLILIIFVLTNLIENPIRKISDKSFEVEQMDN